MSATTWTLVSRKRGARFYRPVANVPAGLDWQGAMDAAHRVDREDTDTVFVVPTTTSHEEDRDNVLQDNGKRVPIRWDAAPVHTYTTPDDACTGDQSCNVPDHCAGMGQPIRVPAGRRLATVHGVALVDVDHHGRPVYYGMRGEDGMVRVELREDTAHTIGGREGVDVLTVRADEVRVGDTIPLRGTVGTVADVVVYGGNLPRVEITATTSTGTMLDVFAADRSVLIERNR